MENTKKNTKKTVIVWVAAVLAAALIIVPLVIIFSAKNVSPIEFLMEKDLSEYVSVNKIESIDYDEVHDALKSGYDVFRVSLTEAYFGTAIYIEEGSTLDFTLSAELAAEIEGGTQYTEINLPEEYTKVVGYRPYSNENNLFFDLALSGAGNLDDYSQHYMTLNAETKFTATVPESDFYGEYAGKTLRFTITVTDYVARYIYLYDGADNSISIVSDWYCKIIAGTSEKSSGKVEEGDVIIYDCVDRHEDGTSEEYTNLYLEVTGDYLQYFEGVSEGDSFSVTLGTVTEDFTVKAVFKSEDAETAVKVMGYENVFALKEELRMWCYAVYSDGFIVLATENAQILSYPDSLISVYTKLEDASWETEFRESAASFAENFGDDTALSTYGITGFETMEDYLDDLLAIHVETLVRELLITYCVAKDFGVLEDLYARYETSLGNYITSGKYNTREEALASLSDNADEACVFYTNFLSPILGTKYASMVNGAPFAEYIADSYAA